MYFVVDWRIYDQLADYTLPDLLNDQVIIETLDLYNQIYFNNALVGLSVFHSSLVTDMRINYMVYSLAQ